MTGMVLHWLDGLTSGGHLSVCSPENDNITLFSSHEVIGYPLHSDSQKNAVPLQQICYCNIVFFDLIYLEHIMFTG